ncbi:MAG TPA: hypothetical protein VG247_02810 [Pseudonocardiaceae bacterium]|nr:hypothetical protein [Pseudonocardiaceae bacterium]
MEQVVVEGLFGVERQERQWQDADDRSADQLQENPDQQQQLRDPSPGREPERDEDEVHERGIGRVRAQNRLTGQV